MHGIEVYTPLRQEVLCSRTGKNAMRIQLSPHTAIYLDCLKMGSHLVSNPRLCSGMQGRVWDLKLSRLRSWSTVIDPLLLLRFQL